MTESHPNKPFSHATGAPVVDNLNIQTAGPRGPALLQDIWLIEKLAQYYPNSDGIWGNAPGAGEPPLPIEGEAAHWDHRVDEDHWEQPGNLFRLMTPDQRQALFGNTARAMGNAAIHIKERHIGNCAKADPAYGDGVAKALGLVKAEAV